ncbi:MAG: hypothetical protein EZS28_002572, partial [Streblomastix strix]
MKVLRTLGKSSSSHVFQVQNDENGLVAAKVISPNKEIVNPFILTYHSIETLDDNAVILMEYANMKNLDILIGAKKDIPIPIIRALMRQILEGLRLMHENGIIHENIKGQNILLHSPPGSGRVIVKIADFEIIPQQPPEMTMDNEKENIKADGKVDVWSAGIIFHQLVTHETPFLPTNSQTEQIVTFDHHPAKDDILWDLLTKMLTFNRKDRISIQDALNHEFFTGEQAMNEVSEEAKNLAVAAQIAKKYSNKSVTQYDTNSLFIIPLTEIQTIIDVDLEADKAQIDSTESVNQILAIDTEAGNSQELEQSIEPQITAPSPVQHSINQKEGDNSLSKQPQLQPEVEQITDEYPKIQQLIIKHKSSSSQSSFQPTHSSSEQIQSVPQIKEEQKSQEPQLIIDYKQIVAILKIPIKGSKEQKIHFQKQQESECVKITNRLKDKDDDEGRNDAITAGVTEELSNIFGIHELSTITQPFVEAFLSVTFPFSWEKRNQIYIKKSPYPGLFRILEHKDIEVVRLAIRSIGSMLICGLIGVQGAEPNLHYESIDSFNGIKKLFSLFKKTKDKQTKDVSSICIGILFHAKEILDKNIRQEVISHLKSIVNDPDKWTKESSIGAISYLALNQENYNEIMKGLNFKAISSLIGKHYVSSAEQRQKILQQQYEKSNLLCGMLQGRKDNELRQQLINSGLVESLFYIFLTRDLESISITFPNLFFNLLVPSSDEIVLQIYSKKPYLHLIRLTTHFDNEIVLLALYSIQNILLSGSKSATFHSMHPHFETIQLHDGVEILYKLFLKTDTNKKIKDTSALCISSIFRTGIIPDQAFRSEIITHLISLLEDPDEWLRIKASNDLGLLAQNSGNRIDIMKDVNYSQMAEILRKPIIDKSDDEIRNEIIKSGIVDSLFFIFETRDLSSISFPFVDVIQQLSYCSNEIDLLIYSKKPYTHLLRLLNHSDFQIIQASILLIYNYLLLRTDSQPSKSHHQHYKEIQAYSGVDKLYTLFKRTDLNKKIIDKAAICLGELYNISALPKSMRIEILNYLKTLIEDSDKQTKTISRNVLENLAQNSESMRTEIINHIIFLVGSHDEFIQDQSNVSIGQLARNSENRFEIIKGIKFGLIAEELRKSYEGSEQQKKKIQNKQEGFCNLLSTLIKVSKDDELRKKIINSGIIDSLLFIFETRDLSSITTPCTDLILQITNGSNEVKMMIYSKKPYPFLLHLLDHSENEIILNSVNSIFNILGFEDKSSQQQQQLQYQHPHFEEVAAISGIEKLYSIFKRKDVNKQVKDKVAICIGILFSSKELQGEMRTEIISHLKTVINSYDSKTRITTRNILEKLAQNSGNYSELLQSIDMKAIAEELKELYEGNEQKKKKTQNKQEGFCILLSTLIKVSKDDQIRKKIINSGIIDSLLFKFETRDLSSITLSQVELFFNLTTGNDEDNLLLYSKNPYPYLLHLLDHSENDIILMSIKTISNILFAGQDSSQLSSEHPHFQTIQQCKGIEKLFSIFKRINNNQIKDNTSINIGLIFRTKSLPDPIQNEIISHLIKIIGDQDKQISTESIIVLSDLACDSEILNYLKTLIEDSDKQTKTISRNVLENLAQDSDINESISNESVKILSDLAQNAENCTEIIKGIKFVLIAEELRQPYEGDEQLKKKIQNKQEGFCILLSILIKVSKDDQLRKKIINSGIVDSLLFIFETRDLSSITLSYIDLFFNLTTGNDEDNLLLYSKNPYPYLLHLLDHSENEIINLAIKSILNILTSGSNSTSSQSEHPHFKTIQSNNRVEKLYTLFTNADTNKEIKDLIAICIGRLFRAKTIPDAIRVEIIDHFIELIGDSDKQTRAEAVIRLSDIAQNTENRTQIIKIIDFISIAEELREPFEGDEESKSEILNKHEGLCNLIYIILHQKKDDQLRKQIINSGVVDSLLSIFGTRELSSITYPLVNTFFQFTDRTTDEVNLLLYSKKPYSQL